MIGSPPGWNRDPYGRHEVRYYDGTSWTEHVSDQGIQGMDPPVGTPLPPPSSFAPDPSYAPAPTFPPPGMSSLPASGLVPGMRYRSIHGLAVALTWLLGVAAVAALPMSGAFLYRRSLLERIRDGDFVSLDDARSADDYVDVAVGLGFVIGLAVFVVLVVFLFRASKNTALWQRERPRWTSGWTIGGWFIPCANLVIPFLVVRDIWRRTPDSVQGAVGSPGMGLLWGWWITWAIGYLASTIARQGSEELDAMIRSDALRVVGALVLAGSSVFLIFVVRALHQRQARIDSQQRPDLAYPAPTGPALPDGPSPWT